MRSEFDDSKKSPLNALISEKDKQNVKEETNPQSVSPDYSSFDDDYQVIGEAVDKVYGQGGSQTIVLKSRAEGHHPPTTLYYASLFDIEDSTDTVENFDPEQDKIDLSKVMQALGEDLSLEHVRLVLSQKTDLKLIVYDGPIGNGNEYHVLTLKSVIKSKETSIAGLLKKCVIV